MLGARASGSCRLSEKPLNANFDGIYQLQACYLRALLLGLVSAMSLQVPGSKACRHPCPGLHAAKSTSTPKFTPDLLHSVFHGSGCTHGQRERLGAVTSCLPAGGLHADAGVAAKELGQSM
jgi:hypothetical protein